MPAGGAFVTTEFVQARSKEFDDIFKDTYLRATDEMTGVAKISSTTEEYIQEGEMSTFRGISKITEGGPAPMARWKEGNYKRITTEEYALAAQITKKMIEDDRLGKLKDIPAQLAKAARTTREMMFWDLFNSGFVTTVRTAIDSKALFAADHPIIDSSQSSVSVVDNLITGVFGYANVQLALDYFETLIDQEGLPAPAKPDLVVIGPSNRHKAKILQMNEYEPGTANNDVNVLADAGLQYKVVHWLTSSTAWFMMNSKLHDLRFITRRQPSPASQVDFITGNMLYKTDARWAADFIRYRYMCGSTGA